MLHDILDDDHIQWHPPLIGHYTNFFTITDLDLITEFDFYLIVQGFHRTYATGAACQQRTLTPPDTWSCPNLGLACVLISRPISPELVSGLLNFEHPSVLLFCFPLLSWKLLYRVQQIFTGSKVSTSSTKFVFFGLIGKPRRPPWTFF